MSEITRGVTGVPFVIATDSDLAGRQLDAVEQGLLAENERLKAELESEVMSWETDRGNGLIPFVSNKRYKLFSPAIQKYYRPVRSSIAAERDQLKAELEKVKADRKACWEEFKVQGRQLDQLKQENRLLTEHNEFLASSDSRLAPELRAVKDALGLDFTASVNGEVVPLIERLRKLPTCWTEVMEQSEANDQLLDQVLELSADADRWRFVRNAIPNQSPIAVWHEGTKPLLGKMADDAVDAARTMAR